MSFNIIGVGDVPTNYMQDFTNANVAAEYRKHMETLERVFANNPITEEDARKVQEAMQALQRLAKDGMAGDSPNDPRYMTTGMLDSINTITLVFSAQGIGILPPEFKATPAQLEVAKVRTIGVSNITGKTMTFPMLITEAKNTQISGATMSLQAMIRFQFVPDTFAMFAAVLGGLKEQMATTKEIETQLATILEIANMTTSATPSGFKPYPDNTYDIPAECVESLASYMNSQSKGLGDEFKKAYNADKANAENLVKNDRLNYPTMEDALKTQTGAANLLKDFMDAKDLDNNVSSNSEKRTDYILNEIYKKHFDQIQVIATPTENAAFELLTAKNNLIKLLEELKAQVKASDNPPNPVSPEKRTGTLAYYLKAVIDDIEDAFKDVVPTGDLKVDKSNYNEALKTWILDNQNKAPGSTGRGSIIANLNQAISMATSLNAELKTNFQDEMTTFQSFIELLNVVIKGIQEMNKSYASGMRAT